MATSRKRVQRFRTGDKVRVVIAFDCDIITDLPSVTARQIKQIVWDDPAFCLRIKSVCTGRLSEKTAERDHDTEINLNQREVRVMPQGYAAYDAMHEPAQVWRDRARIAAQHGAPDLSIRQCASELDGLAREMREGGGPCG